MRYRSSASRSLPLYGPMMLLNKHLCHELKNVLELRTVRIDWGGSNADHADPEKTQNKNIYFDLFTVKINNLLLENAFSVIN